ncbi:DUF4363 family protein [Paenibacillus polymyxa]|uniref:DUF4363 family protein n=1 Tax=Paenibacillus TaxID=44249 RepID=UPI000881C32D|nr:MULTISPECIES: DUF4363 family protein [Paenibacillus]UOK61420.1 DUF4363 family protein [Paenibacillus sp. OVF10]MCL6661957.1 DUF4363 family protein [Paenibacillus amylolyticus]TDL69414.1 DUF4363 family protein [Paenibacillus amylolyticus]WJM05945.1 DUF4363 family protein [Paenibacillus sp. PK1-4R]SDC52615.1 protein of unknown function [Paenibacillus sp. CF095]
MKTRFWLLYVLPIFLILVFVAIMASGAFLKKPFGNDDRLLESIQTLEKQVEGKQWTEAKSQVNYAMQAWDKVVNRIQFSVERETIYDILGTLARIKGGVAAEDDKAIMEEIYYFYVLWDNLGD